MLITAYYTTSLVGATVTPLLTLQVAHDLLHEEDVAQHLLMPHFDIPIQQLWG